ncbi:hypothetical protein A3C57_00935 [Candidatus Nomurabacteria bacterium RIFCSPHIGHO2_02_FULL_33_12]|uniref:Uncharacterized protein n=1 Tax=Candidatus Nomurabacteria bacterium RIFCSPLOWO2_01_FULL_33_17 TaxID=1801764 RepID=A0A1F6WQP5_9BACT|nr:MAG: hypothetical protein A3C57_00935 [Candidatus Nomurabacteria bacterium RIFCSPHIGHO2_02_FULL_33_12]OGI84187.1 MAG: hypothetical protein A2903_00535 [Candidatus Nomurabacteria bacterium RIFCSPLOWO2_01_FULL_33_17]
MSTENRKILCINLNWKQYKKLKRGYYLNLKIDGHKIIVFTKTRIPNNEKPNFNKNTERYMIPLSLSEVKDPIEKRYEGNFPEDEDIPFASYRVDISEPAD